MGQHPSKRRSYTPGQDANSEIPSSPAVNGDVKGDVKLNGGIVEHRNKKTLTTQVSTTSSGKKEKRRKLKFTGFPIRRTASGRWTRKRRSVKANGATNRPLSCPVTSPTEAADTSSQRPQSLFLEEFEVHEEEGGAQVETVDLSDHEDGKSKGEAGKGPAPVPKPREKKAKRNSSKKSDSKKKKKEKKKEPKEKSKAKKAGGESSDQGNEEEVDLSAMAASIVQDTVNNARERLMAELATSAEISESNDDIEATEDSAESPSSASSQPIVSSHSVPDESHNKEAVVEVIETSVSISATESAPPVLESGNDDPEIVEEEIVAVKAPEKVHTLPLFLLREREEEGAKDSNENSKNSNSDEDERTPEKENKQVQDEGDNGVPKETANEAVDVAEKVETEIEDLLKTSTTSSIFSAPKSVEEAEDKEVVEETIVVEKADEVKTVPVVDVEGFSEPKSVRGGENEVVEEIIVVEKVDKVKSVPTFVEDKSVEGGDKVAVEETIVVEKADKVKTVPVVDVEGFSAPKSVQGDENEVVEETIVVEKVDKVKSVSTLGEDKSAEGGDKAVVEETIVLEKVDKVKTVPKFGEDKSVEDEHKAVVEETIVVEKVDKVKTVPIVDVEVHVDAPWEDTENNKNEDIKDDNVVPQEKEDGTTDLTHNVTPGATANVDNSIDVEVVKEKEEEMCEKIDGDNNGSSNAGDSVDGDLAVVAQSVVQSVITDSIGQIVAENENNGEDKAQDTVDAPRPSTQTQGETCKGVDITPTEDLETDVEAKATAIKEQKEKERAEKQRLKKQKEEEKAKEKERIREQKRKRAEEKAVGKEKSKGDRKSLPKRISSWFKKDKPKSGQTSSSSRPQSMISTNEEVPSSSAEESALRSLEPVAVAASSSSSSSSPLVQESLTIDVSVQPMERSDDPAKSSPSSPSMPDAQSPNDSAPVSPTSEADSNLHSDSSAPVSPSPEDADTGGPPGALKKINLGPRLRTAILRKKSSSASESGQEERRVSLTQPKSVETTELTPPPRKFRPRKQTEQYTPVTKGAHNPMKSQSPQLETRESSKSKELAVEKEPEVVDKVLSTSQEVKEIVMASDVAEVVACSISQSSPVPEEQQENSPTTADEVAEVEESMTSTVNTKAVVNFDKLLKRTDKDNSSSQDTKEDIKLDNGVEAVAISISQSSQENALESNESSAEEELKTEEKKEFVSHDSNAKEITNAVDVSDAVISSVTKEITANVESHVVTSDAAADEAQCEVSLSAVSADPVQSAAIPNVSVSSSEADGASNKDCVNEEIIQVSKITRVQCHLPEVRAFRSPDVEVETYDNVPSPISQSEVNTPAPLSLTFNTGANKEAPENGHSQTSNDNVTSEIESQSLPPEVESPSVVSTANIIFKPMNKEASGPQTPTAQADDPATEDSSSQEVRKSKADDESYSIQVTQSTTIVESVVHATILDVSESNRATETKTTMESQTSPKSAVAESNSNETRHPGPQSSLTIVSQILDEIVDSSSSSLSPNSLKLDEDEEEDDEETGSADAKFSAVCSAQIKEDVRLLTVVNEEPEDETSFITFPTNGVDSGDNHHVTANGQWAEKELDVQLDDSAIEMDKESPLADGCPETGSALDSGGKEDDGVGSGSDNSSDCNDGGKSGPNATIDAYLKLQRVEVEVTHQGGSEINGSVSPDLTTT